nr:7358_t:CDS:2 [Entrophospora candida]CAG8628678.1 1761_t:CDS:2 [Entrophospora candida]
MEKNSSKSSTQEQNNIMFDDNNNTKSSSTPLSTTPSLSLTTTTKEFKVEEGGEENKVEDAYNEETEEINWDCPCLGGMANGPCGEQFKVAFSCFVYSKEEPKGIDCLDAFKEMNNCFKQHPDIYRDGGIFSTAIVQTEHKRNIYRYNMNPFKDKFGNDNAGGDVIIFREGWIKGIFGRQLQRIQDLEIYKELHKNFRYLKNKWWNNWSEADKTIAVLIGINTLVFLMWQIPTLRPFMTQNFLHNPLSGRSYTLLTSTFSHLEIWHLALNMFALYSFGDLTHRMVGGREQFLALYLSSGLFSSCASHVITLMTKAPLAILPTLGASGAIFACVSVCAIKKPDLSVVLIFLPIFPIKLGYAFPAMLAFDVYGIVSGMTIFDHYAHLAGALFGYFSSSRKSLG